MEHTGTDLCTCPEDGRSADLETQSKQCKPCGKYTADETERSVCGCRQRVEHLYPDRGTGKDPETERCGYRTEQAVHMDA